MDDLQTLTQLLSSGGDVATAFIAWAIWRLDRRVYRLELQAEQQGEAA